MIADVRRHKDGDSVCTSREFLIQSTFMTPRRNSGHHLTSGLHGNFTRLMAWRPSMHMLAALYFKPSLLIQLCTSFCDHLSMTSTLENLKSGPCTTIAKSANAPMNLSIHLLAVCLTTWARIHATFENRTPTNAALCERHFRCLETSWRIRSFLETILTATNANSIIINCIRIGSSMWHGTTPTSSCGPIPKLCGLAVSRIPTETHREVDEQSDEPKRRIGRFLRSTFFGRRWVIGAVIHLIHTELAGFNGV